MGHRAPDQSMEVSVFTSAARCGINAEWLVFKVFRTNLLLGVKASASAIILSWTAMGIAWSSVQRMKERGTLPQFDTVAPTLV